MVFKPLSVARFHSMFYTLQILIVIYVLFFASRTPDDIEIQRDCYECNTTTHPPTSTGGQLVERLGNEIQRENVVIISGLATSGTNNFTQSSIILTHFHCYTAIGFCDSEPSAYGGVWPEVEAGDTVSLPCEGGSVTRECSPDNGGQWLTPDDSVCAGTEPTATGKCLLLFLF